MSASKNKKNVPINVRDLVEERFTSLARRQEARKKAGSKPLRINRTLMFDRFLEALEA